MSCEKQEKICTETCCSFDSARYKFIADLKDAEANLGNNGFWLKTPLNGAHGVIICDLSLDMVKGLPFTYDPKNIADSTFAYRISGKLYDNLDDFPLTSYQQYMILN